MIVLHYTAMRDCQAALDRLCAPEFEVSAHYLIGADGTIIQMVDEARRAWHAGAGRWGDVADVNSRSIGIELDNDGQSVFVEPQMRALERLLTGVMRRWSIRPERVVGHSDTAPDRKVDPGPHFDWQRLARRGLSVWPSDDRQTQSRTGTTGFLDDLARIGYAPEFGEEAMLRAFRMRFRGGLGGQVDEVDIAMASDLARRFPVDRRCIGS